MSGGSGMSVICRGTTGRGENKERGEGEQREGRTERGEGEQREGSWRTEGGPIVAVSRKPV